MLYSTSDEDTALLEGLLFLSGRPMSTDDISIHMQWPRKRVEAAAASLERRLAEDISGISLMRFAGGYQLATKGELYEKLHWRRESVKELSPAAMEVLAIVAFKQPVTRAEVEKIRGVSSERLMAVLLQQDLIADLGRKDSPGRPILYGTSPYFLECLGIDSIEDLAQHMPVSEGERTEGGEADERTVTEGNE